MIKYAVALAAVVSICGASPIRAEEVGIGVSPRGVTVIESRGDRDRDRDREHFRDRDRRGRDETVIIGRDREHDRDRDRHPIVIDRD